MKLRSLEGPQVRAARHHPSKPVPPKRPEDKRKPDRNAAEEYRLAQLKKQFEAKFGKGSWPKGALPQGADRFRPSPRSPLPVRPPRPVEAAQPRRPGRPVGAPKQPQKPASPDKGIYTTVDGKKVKLVLKASPINVRPPRLDRNPFTNPRRSAPPQVRQTTNNQKDKDFHFPKQPAGDICETIHNPKAIELFCKKYPKEDCCQKRLDKSGKVGE